MYPKFNLYSYYNQCNHLYAPKYFDWVKDGSGTINFFVDDYIRQRPGVITDKPNIAILIEPRTIQPTIYEWVEQNYNMFDIIFSHDMKILQYKNACPIFFMNWYKTYDVAKTKNISMVCSDKAMCNEHAARKKLADLLASDIQQVDHYGKYLGGRYCDYYECRAEYMFEIVVDNNWNGYWLSEKLANPLASKTIPIYLGGKHFPNDLDMDGIIRAESTEDIPLIVNNILRNPKEEYYYRIKAVEHNYNAIQRYHVFEDWLFEEYYQLFEDLCKRIN